MRTQIQIDREAKILDRVRAIPEGFVRTYGDIWPDAPRLPGQILGATKEKDLPWWRVVHSDGTLAKGERQRRRLSKEGVPFRKGSTAKGATPRVDLDVARIPEGAAE